VNVTDKILSNEDYRQKYFAKLDGLNAQKNMFMDLTKRMRELDEKTRKAEGKKKRRAGG